jgi:hypothetical protein
MKQVSIVDEESKPTPTVIKKVSSIKEAEQWIAEQESIDPQKVHRGGYGIDAPESFLK